MKARVFQSAAVLAVIALIAASAQAATVAISIGVRETGTTAPIGGNGGASGSIEFINQDGQSLTLDGTWQKFTFDFGTAAVAGFTGNGVLNGTRGTLEHIRIRNVDGTTRPFSLWIDEVVNSVGAVGGPGDVLLTGFEGYAADQQVIFRQPSYSGSTSGNLAPAPAPNSSGVDNGGGYAGASSYRVEFQFKDDDAAKWLRLTTYGAPALPNPAIDFASDSSLSFWVKGTPEPATLVLLGLGGLLLRRRR